MTQEQIDKKYRKSLVLSVAMLVVALVLIALWLVGMHLSNSIMISVCGTIGFALLIIGFVYTLLAKRDYNSMVEKCEE